MKRTSSDALIEIANHWPPLSGQHLPVRTFRGSKQPAEQPQLGHQAPRAPPTRESHSRLDCLPPVAAPPLDGAADDAFLVAGLAPQAGEARVGRGGALLGLEVVEADPDRDRDALAASDALAVAKRGDRVEEAPRAFGHRRPDAGLVAVVVEAHRDDRAA